MKLHIACGARVIEGWINLDKNRKVDGVIPFDSTLVPWQIGNNIIAPDSIDAVYSEDFFEHLTQAEQFLYLNECKRVIKKNGIIRIVTPDIIYSLSHMIIDHDTGILDLSKDYYDLKHGHKFIVTAGYLFDILPIFGFSKIRLHKRNESKIIGFEGDSRPNPKGGWDRTEEGQIYLEAVRV